MASLLSTTISGNLALTAGPNASFITISGNTTTAPTIIIAANSTSGIVYGNNSITGAPSITMQTNTGVPYITVGNGTSIATSANHYSNGFIVGTSVINSIAHAAGSNNYLSTTALVLTGNTTTAPTLTISSNSTSGIVYGNSTITGAPTLTMQTNTGVPYITVANNTNLTTSANHYSNGFIVGTSIVNATAHAAGSNNYLSTTALVLTGNTTTAPTLTISSNSTSGIIYGNTTITGTPYFAFQNSISLANLTSTTLSINTISATTNGAVLTAAALNIGNTSVNTQIAPNSLILRANSTAQTSLTGTTFSSNTSTIANMWSNLPGGLIMQWGIVVANATGSNTVTFGNAYVTNAYSVIVTPISNTTVFAIGHANNITKTGFTVQCGNTTALNNTGIPGVYWLAIGA